MTDIPDNPPAFPRTGEGVREGETHPRYDCPGMTLRDWFAGQALNVLGGMYASGEIDVSGSFEVANMAYSLADAMLAEREKRYGR
jgi:hypothetical protein